MYVHAQTCVQCVSLFVHCTHCTKCTKYVCVCAICMCIYSIYVHLQYTCALCVHIYIINHPTNRLQQKEATIQHQQNASTMQLLQIQNGVIYANGIRKFVRKTPLERWYL